MKFFMITVIFCSNSGPSFRKLLCDDSNSSLYQEALFQDDTTVNSFYRYFNSINRKKFYHQLSEIIIFINSIVRKYSYYSEKIETGKINNDIYRELGYIDSLFKKASFENNASKFKSPICFECVAELFESYLKEFDFVIDAQEKINVCRDILKGVVLRLLKKRFEIFNNTNIPHEVNYLEPIVHSNKQTSSPKVTFNLEKSNEEIEKMLLLDIFSIESTPELDKMSYIQTYEFIKTGIILLKYEKVNDVSLQDNLRKYKRTERVKRIANNSTCFRIFPSFDIFNKLSSEYDIIVKIEFNKSDPNVDSTYHLLALALKDIVVKNPDYFLMLNNQNDNFLQLHDLFKEFAKKSSSIKLESYFRIIHILKKVLSTSIKFEIPHFYSTFIKPPEEKNITHDHFTGNFEKSSGSYIFNEKFFWEIQERMIPKFFKIVSEILELNVIVFDYSKENFPCQFEPYINALGTVMFGIYRSDLYFIQYANNLAK